MDDMEFLGGHVALFLGDELIVILRDDLAHTASPNCWGFSGWNAGCRRNPIADVDPRSPRRGGFGFARKCDLPCGAVSVVQPAGLYELVLCARLDAKLIDRVVLGDEGQRWMMMTPDHFLNTSNVVPSFPPQLIAWMALQTT